jgi:hypothetical protein
MARRGEERRFTLPPELRRFAEPSRRLEEAWRTSPWGRPPSPELRRLVDGIRRLRGAALPIEEVTKQFEKLKPLMDAAQRTKRISDEMQAQHEAMREAFEERFSLQMRQAEANLRLQQELAETRRSRDAELAELRRQYDAELAELRDRVEALVRQILAPSPPPAWDGTVEEWLDGKGDWPGAFAAFPLQPGEKIWAIKRDDDHCRRIVREAGKAGLRLSPSTVNKLYPRRQ